MQVSVSVIICAHNEEIYIERCLRSIRNQKTFSEFEVIVVDDASTDNTARIVENFSMKNLRLIRNESCMGIGRTSNIGIENASGRLVVRVDADDYVSEHFLEVLVSAINETRNHAVRIDYININENEVFLSQGDSSKEPIACGIMYRKDSLVRVGLYNQNLRLGEDTDLERRFSAEYEILHLPVPLYRYRQHSRNSSKKLRN